MSDELTIEQAAELLSRERWLDRDDWRVYNAKLADHAQFVQSGGQKAPPFGVAGDAISYSPIEVIAIAKSLVAEKRIEELESTIEGKNRLLPSLIQEGKQIAEDRIDDLEQQLAELKRAVEPFAQLTGLGKEDELPDSTILAIHLWNVHGWQDIQFFRHQKPARSLTVGDLRRLRTALAAAFPEKNDDKAE